MIFVFKDSEDKKIGKCVASGTTEAKTYAKEHKINWCTIDILEDETPKTDIQLPEEIYPTVNENLTVQDVTNQEWYTSLIEELQACIVETSFTSRMAIIEGKHFIGKEILKHEDKFTQSGYLKASEQIASSLGKSQRDIEQCIQFARKYPDLDLLPVGKNYSWHMVTQELLPEHSQDTLESKSKPITKAELIQIIKEVKILLQHEWQESNQVLLDKTADDVNKDFYSWYTDKLRDLQDQFNKIIGDVKL